MPRDREKHTYRHTEDKHIPTQQRKRNTVREKYRQRDTEREITPDIQTHTYTQRRRDT